jgi:dephospho-CoA kinase
MTVIGIVGGIASGKTAVSDALRDLGAEVIHADQIGHAVLNEPSVLRELQGRWGTRILGPAGQVNRAAIASIVFDDSPGAAEELRFLQSVTHPRIEQQIRQQIQRLKKDGSSVIVLDAPILLEAGWERHCDKILFVDVDRSERLRRALARGWTEAQFAARESSQLNVGEKRKVADKVIDNSASFDHTLAQLQQFWRSLDSLPPE